jgi:hypothetical protein
MHHRQAPGFVEPMLLATGRDLVVEIGLWLLFWNGLGIPSLKDLLHLNIPRLSPSEITLSGALVIAITGAVFWLFEMREGIPPQAHR